MNISGFVCPFIMWFLPFGYYVMFLWVKGAQTIVLTHIFFRFLIVKYLEVEMSLSNGDSVFLPSAKVAAPSDSYRQLLFFLPFLWVRKLRNEDDIQRWAHMWQTTETNRQTNKQTWQKKLEKSHLKHPETKTGSNSRQKPSVKNQLWRIIVSTESCHFMVASRSSQSFLTFTCRGKQQIDTKGEACWATTFLGFSENKRNLAFILRMEGLGRSIEVGNWSDEGVVTLREDALGFWLPPGICYRVHRNWTPLSSKYRLEL